MPLGLLGGLPEGLSCGLGVSSGFFLRSFSHPRDLNPEGPARHLDAARQKLTPHCLVAIFDSQLPSPKLSLTMPPKLPLPRREVVVSSFKIAPAVMAIVRQLSGKNCLAAILASRH